LADTNATDKANLSASEDKFKEIFFTIHKELTSASLEIEANNVSITINSNNPDPTKISIEVTDNSYRVIYWDGYAVNEYYDYQNFNKALKKFKKFSDKALTNIKKFGIK
jgi:hypothetical protein